MKTDFFGICKSGYSIRLIPIAFFLVVVHLAFELRGRAKIEEEADFTVCGIQVVEQLGFMFRKQRFYRFEFNDDEPLHDLVCIKLTYHFTIIIYTDRHFGLNQQTLLCFFDEHRFLIHALQETIPELVIDGIKTLDDLPSQHFMFHNYPRFPCYP
jgi:hypothetical protein